MIFSEIVSNWNIVDRHKRGELFEELLLTNELDFQGFGSSNFFFT